MKATVACYMLCHNIPLKIDDDDLEKSYGNQVWILNLPDMKYYIVYLIIRYIKALTPKKKKNLCCLNNVCAGAVNVSMVCVFSWKEMLEQCLVWAFLHSRVAPSDGLMCLVQEIWQTRCRNLRKTTERHLDHVIFFQTMLKIQRRSSITSKYVLHMD